MNPLIWLRRLALAAVLLCLVVVVLGAYVRLTAAGLGCPDWPGCYGHLTPSGAENSPASQAAFASTPFDLGKAWREMAHRYAATTLGLIIVGIAALAIRTREARLVSVPHALLLLATVVVQGVLGMLTVTWQLKPLLVTLHLLFGLATLALLWWLYLRARRRPLDSIPHAALASAGESRRARTFVIAGLIVLSAQIALGGWTSSNYAAFACPDFPTCQNAWWPVTDYRDAYVLWRGLGINYEGGVLEHPARVAIHFTHRLGAIIASVVLLAGTIVVLRRPALARARDAAVAVIIALGLQLAIGIFMVLEAFPLSLATAHNGGAALLMLAVVSLSYQLSEAA
jgi:cytochrome c oxidase assembly protein subunit 15